MAVHLETHLATAPPISRGPAAWAAPSRGRLRTVLALSDVVVILATWLWMFNALGIHHGGLRDQLVPLLAVVGVTIPALAFKQLYLSRVCRVRVIEVSRLARATLGAGLVVHLAESPLGLDLSVQRSLAAAGTMWAGLCISRGFFASWMRRRRTRGHDTRPIVILGPSEDGAALERLVSDNPECGWRVAAVLAPTSDVMGALEAHRSDSVLLVNGACGSQEQSRLVKGLQELGVHVHYSTGFDGIDHRRLRPQPIGRVPLFYVERLTVSPWQLVAKRAVDIVGGGLGLIAAAPILVVAALAITFEDRGPVFYRQERVGLGGRPFRVFKLRTMIPGADRQLHLVVADNERVGPLYKSRSDQRVTRVGKFLRATSLDELPQLLNVLQGTMSLVGPRPALAHEVEQFDLELQSRTRVRPGMTGLWQIEGRDHPSFDVYRRLDLYYIDNWTLEFDFVILMATAQAVLAKALGDLRHKSAVRPSVPDDAEAVIDLRSSSEDAGVTVDLTTPPSGSVAL